MESPLPPLQTRKSHVRPGAPGGEREAASLKEVIPTAEGGCGDRRRAQASTLLPSALQRWGSHWLGPRQLTLGWLSLMEALVGSWRVAKGRTWDISGDDCIPVCSSSARTALLPCLSCPHCPTGPFSRPEALGSRLCHGQSDPGM